MTPQTVRIPDYHYDDERGLYVLDEWIDYISPRYGKRVFCEVGMTSDGATGAMDIISASWWVHDKLCETGTFYDKTPCTNWQASNILHDILEAEGYWARAEYWRMMTYWFGGKKLE